MINIPEPNGYSYFVTIKGDPDHYSIYRDSDDECIMDHIARAYKDQAVNIEYMPNDLADKKADVMFEQWQNSKPTTSDDEPDYDLITADERWTTAFEQHRTLHS